VTVLTLSVVLLVAAAYLKGDEFVLGEILNQDEDVLDALEYLHDDLDDDLTTDDDDTIIGSSTGTIIAMTTTTNKTLMLTEPTAKIMMMRMPIPMPISVQT
jgi:hypothetical protein